MRSKQRDMGFGKAPAPTGPYSTYASEAEIQAAIIVLLKHHPKVAWAHRMNTGSTKAEYTSKKTNKTTERWIRFAFKGCADILGQMKDGRFMAIEVKKWDGRPTLEQQAFIDRVRQFGGVAGVARSVEDAQYIIEEREPELMEVPF